MNFIDLRQKISFNLSNVGKIFWVECERTIFKFGTKKFLSCASLLHKVGKWNYEVSSIRATMAKKCTKTRNAQAKLFFCPSKPIAIVVIQKFCSHGNVTSRFSSLSVFPMKIPGEFDPGDYGMIRFGKTGQPAGLQNLAFFRLAKTKPKRAKDARVETHSKEHPLRVFLCSP